MRRSGHCRITSIHVMCVHIADTQGGRDAHARAATVTKSCRCRKFRQLHRAELQPGATVDCMASARHHERRDSSGWWKGRENAGRRPRDNETHASRRGMARKWCERKGHRARAARPSFGRRPEEGPGSCGRAGLSRHLERAWEGFRVKRGYCLCAQGRAGKSVVNGF